MKYAGLVCLKILLVAALALALFHFWPMLSVPLALGAVVALGLGALLLAGLVAAGAVGVGVIAALTAVALTVLGALSPVWIPLLVLLGCVWLVKRLCTRRGPGAPAT